MMGSAATSMSSMLNKVIDISPPQAELIDLQETIDESKIDEFLSDEFLKISFRLEVGDLIDSDIMQLYPISFAKELCENVTENMKEDADQTAGAASQEVPGGAAPKAADGSSYDGTDGGSAADDDGFANADGYAADGRTNDESGYVTDVWTAGECAAGTVPAVCRKYTGWLRTGKYRFDYGCTA